MGKNKILWKLKFKFKFKDLRVTDVLRQTEEE